MIVEIYSEGQCLADITQAEVTILSYYLGMDKKGFEHKEDFITLGIGTNKYWNCLLKLTNNEAHKLESFLKSAREKTLHQNQVGVVTSDTTIAGESK